MTSNNHVVSLIEKSISAVAPAYITKRIVCVLVQQMGIKTPAELVLTLSQLGLPQTKQEQRELLELAQCGPMRSDLYYRWATAIRDAESTWSVTKKGKAALAAECPQPSMAVPR